MRLLNVSENATCLVEDPEAGPSVLRVHRLGHHFEPAIASELARMDALRTDSGVRTPRVLNATDGRVVSVGLPADGSPLRPGSGQAAWSAALLARSCRARADPSEVSTASCRGSSCPRMTAWM